MSSWHCHPLSVRQGRSIAALIGAIAAAGALPASAPARAFTGTMAATPATDGASVTITATVQQTSCEDPIVQPSGSGGYRPFNVDCGFTAYVVRYEGTGDCPVPGYNAFPAAGARQLVSVAEGLTQLEPRTAMVMLAEDPANFQGAKFACVYADTRNPWWDGSYAQWQFPIARADYTVFREPVSDPVPPVPPAPLPPAASQPTPTVTAATPPEAPAITLGTPEATRAARTAVAKRYKRWRKGKNRFVGCSSTRHDWMRSCVARWRYARVDYEVRIVVKEYADHYTTDFGRVKSRRARP